MKAFVRVLPDHKLVAADEDTEKYLNNRKPGDVLSLEIKIARNYENHKRFFSFIKQTFDMQDHFTEIEAYRKWITLQAGYFDTIIEPNGRARLIPQSIAFEKMEEDEFQELFSAAIDVFLRELGAGLTENDVLQAISYA